LRRGETLRRGRRHRPTLSSDLPNGKAGKEQHSTYTLLPEKNPASKDRYRNVAGFRAYPKKPPD